MSDKEIYDKKMRELMKLFDEFEELDSLDTDAKKNAYDLNAPYSNGKKPEPAKWLDNSVRHKMA